VFPELNERSDDTLADGTTGGSGDSLAVQRGRATTRALYVNNSLMPSRSRILLSVFACLPEGTAEDCVGWNWATRLARHHEVWAIADANRQRQIEAYLASRPVTNVQWGFHDIRGRLRPFSNLEPTAYIHYAVWQFGAYLRARQLHLMFTSMACILLTTYSTGRGAICRGFRFLFFGGRWAEARKCSYERRRD
jgi:hypothetical protein